MALINPKFQQCKFNYFWQPLLVFGFVTLILICLHDFASSELQRVLGYMSMGASSVIVFGSPSSDSARPRNILGGFFVSIMIGVGCHWLYTLVHGGWHALDVYYIHFAFAGLAITLTMFLFLLFDVRHPPAAGLTLGFLMVPWTPAVLAVIASGAMALSMLRLVLKEYLVDLV